MRGHRVNTVAGVPKTISLLLIRSKLTVQTMPMAPGLFQIKSDSHQIHLKQACLKCLQWVSKHHQK